MNKFFHSRKLRDFLITFFLLLFATALCFLLFFRVSKNSTNMALIYILCIITIARHTTGYLYGILASVFSVVCINYFFTYPYLIMNFIRADYPFTFLCMFTISIVTSATTSHLKIQSDMLKLRENQLLEADKEKMRANLLRAVSHDLRTPLTSIIGELTILEENDESYSSAERKKVLHNIYDDASWLLNMVENLLTVTRIQTRDSKIKTSPEMVEEVVAEALARLKKRFPEIEIDVSIPDEFLLIPMDAMLIEQVLINLLENAHIHAHSQKPPKLIVESLPDTVCFHVIDYGIGITEKHLDTIFDGIYDSALSDVRKGMGIGLSICKTIVTAHNGTILARNHDSGAEFLFTLPKEEQHV